ncbi:MAG: M23 family metallopeptidase [Deltaproteobacteria bacterium]|nr:M23 family metallopeptidase [Deltaproteobacteria bacterium]
MPRSTRRPKTKTKAKSKGKSRTQRLAAARPARPKRRSSNRRVDPATSKGTSRAARRERKALTVAERKARNRTALLITMLALVNAYVFLWRGEGALASFGSTPAAVIGGDHSGPLPPVASPPAQACSGDPVRIFEGLDDLVHLRATLSRGFTLRLALLQLGIDGTEIDTIETNVRPHVDLSLLGGSGAPVRVAMDRLGGVRALELELAEGHVLQACRDSEASGGFKVRNLQHPLRSDVEVIALTLGRSADLSAAVEAADEKPELAHAIAAKLGADVDFMTEARPEDELTVVVEKRWLGRNFHRYGTILALRFSGVATRVEHFAYKPEGAPASTFDAKGRPIRRALLRSPVGYHRVAPAARGMLPPSLEVVEGRVGAAYRLPQGAPLVAVADGIIVDIGRDAERGQYLDLELSDDTVVRYAHLLRTVGSLDLGTEVDQGQIIALAGHSGRTPHDRLRLELWQPTGGEPKTVDPMLLLAKGSARAPRVGAGVPQAQLSRYAEDIAPRRRALRVAHD